MNVIKNLPLTSSDHALLLFVQDAILRSIEAGIGAKGQVRLHDESAMIEPEDIQSSKW